MTYKKMSDVMGVFPVDGDYIRGSWEWDDELNEAIALAVNNHDALVEALVESIDLADWYDHENEETFAAIALLKAIKGE